ncbi:MAG: O-antigen ligase family protein, partial [Pseudomonadota bacterium]
ILLTAAAMTESQTVPLVCLLSFLGYWLARMAPKVLAWAGAGISALYILTAPWIFVAIYQPAIEQFRDWTSASAGARLEIWRAVGGLSLERPVFGWGPEAIGKMEGIFSEDDFFMNRSNHLTAHHPHNFALQAWLDLGAIGAIVVTALIILAFFRISHLPRPLAAAGVGMMTALIVGGSLSPGLWQAWWISAICLAVCQFIIATRSDQPFAIAQIGASRPL